MSGPEITAIIPIRNRSGVRLENCVRSLRWQRGLPWGTLEIVLSDFGSTAEHLSSVQQIAQAHQARVVSFSTDEMWCRGRALNIGIQAATAPLCFCTDADMVFSPGFVAAILALERSVRSDPAEPARSIVTAPCFDLPEGAAAAPVEQGQFDALRAVASFRDTGGTGACQVAPRAFFHAVRGYDEGYRHWGGEDDDLLWRAQRYGLKRLVLGDEESMLHQWHPTMKHDRPLLRRVNDWRYLLTRHRVVKNRRGWGRREERD